MPTGRERDLNICLFVCLFVLVLVPRGDSKSRIAETILNSESVQRDPAAKSARATKRRRGETQ